MIIVNTVPHLDAECHECGESPILGVRYRSTQRHAYDICQLCFQQHHCDENNTNNNNSQEFVMFEKRATPEELRRLSPPRGGGPTSAVANSLEDLTKQLQDTSSTAAEDVEVYLNLNRFTPFPDPTIIRLRLALLQNKTVKSLRVFLRGTSHLTTAMQILAEALVNNKSIRSLSVSVCASRRQGRADAAAQALQTLLETNRTIRFFHFKTVSRFGLHGSDRDDVVADYLFSGLAKTTLCRFLYVGHTLVSNHNQHKACEAMKSNPHLRRIECNFDEDDGQLAILTGMKTRRWMERWTGDTATKEERIGVLEEILHSRWIADKTSAMYLFLRCHPRLLLEEVLE